MQLPQPVEQLPYSPAELTVLELLRQDGITDLRAWFGLLSYALVTPGLFRRIFPGWVRYFLPRFHPWNQDDRALIGLYDSDYADANLPMLEAAE